MKRIIILTDEQDEFLVSKADSRNYTSMDVERIRKWFTDHGYSVAVYRFSQMETDADFVDTAILFQTSEAPGGFYKHYIEDLVYILEEKGAVVLPYYKYLKAHHDKIFMEFIRMSFRDEALKSIHTNCYGSWVDALNYNGGYPVVIKQASGSAGKGVYLARNSSEFRKYVVKAGKVIIAADFLDLSITWLKNLVKKTVKLVYPDRAMYFQYNTEPVSNPIVVQNFISGLAGDYKVLFFGGRFYCMYRKNRKNDFRASGSGQFYDVPEKDQTGLLDFARRLTLEIKFPIIGMDIGFDGSTYHLIEFQMIHLGTSALQRSSFWHEYHDGNWIRIDGKSVLEDEFARSVHEFVASIKG